MSIKELQYDRKTDFDKMSLLEVCTAIHEINNEINKRLNVIIGKDGKHKLASREVRVLRFVVRNAYKAFKEKSVK